ncbi:hypothetical protein LCGC14_1230530 [marine sediment metagenome]|uniref:Restriction alleviation protein, Lar family n=1 Tax=marine sediment metagenome TaxID=412755 RepID=A0A0F9LCS5_9ZZZZ
MDLKPCPFCGSEKLVFHKYSPRHASFSCFYYVACESCKSETSMRDSRELASESWNQRKIPNIQYAEVLVEWMKDSRFKEEYTALQTVFDRLVELIVEEERKSGT